MKMTDDLQDLYETPGTTPDFKTELAAQLSELVPEAIADGKVDVEKMRELLSDDVADTNERFGLFWPGKKRALRAAQEPTTATLKPDIENSKDWATTQNVFIEGDNLEVLKILQKHYHGKIKMIYIDPPYNTGKDFVYPDNYKEGLDTYLEWTRQVNDEGKKVSTNSESEGRYHSNWLNMMYPRLRLARNLLADDGVIFISIDDNEAAHLRKLCDEVFGEHNFIAAICHKSRGSVSNDKVISANHNTVLLYARRYSRIFEDRKLIGLDPDLSGFDQSDEHGFFKLVPVDGPGGARKGNPFYEFLGVEGYFRYSKETMQSLYDAGEIVKRGNTLQRKYYLEKATRSRKTDTTWWEDAGYSSSATAALKGLMGGAYFDSPKPVSLVLRMLKQFAPPEGSLVLDFFAGSGTTAQAVLEANAEDGGTRKFILVQLPEPTPEGSPAREAGYETISGIAMERVSLAGANITEKLTSPDFDAGFRVFCLTETNFSKWRSANDLDVTALEQHLLDLRDSADDGATPESLLTEILLKQGYSLSEQIDEITVDDLQLKSVGDGLVLAYLDEHIKPSLDQLRTVLGTDGLAKFIILEDAFQGDDELKTNLVQEAKTRRVELWTA